MDFDKRWNGWTALGGYFGTDQSSYGELSVLAPLAQTPDSLFFTEIDGKFFDGDVLEGNLALGYRRMTSSGFNLGIWAGVDGRNTASDNFFGQVSGGVEALSEHFDARLNGYLALSGSQTAAPGVADVILDGANIFMIGGEEVPLSGFDGEVGLRLPFANNAGALGIYGGGFWFDSADAPEAVTGPKARVELAFNDIVGPGSRLTGEYEYSHDNVRGDRHQIGARLRIPLGPTPPAAAVSQQWLRMTDRLERDTDIVIVQSGEEQVADGYTEVRFDQVAYAGDNGSLDTAITTGGTGANTLIILDGGAGDIAEQKTLNAEQTLLGGGGTLRVVGVESGAVGFVTAPGVRPTIVNPAGSGFALTLAGYNTVNGIDVVADHADTGQVDNLMLGGIDGHDTHMVAIVDTNVTASMAGTGFENSGQAGIVSGVVTGIDLSGATNVWLLGTHVEATMAGTGASGGIGTIGFPSSTVSTGIPGADNVENGNGGSGGNATGSGGNGSNGDSDADSGGAGIVGGVLTGIALTNATQVHLADITVVATMTGIGFDANRASGSGGVGIGNVVGTAGGIGSGGGTPPTTGIGGNGGNGTADAGNGGSGGMGGDGGIGIDGGKVVGIDLSGDAAYIWITHTTVTAAMSGTGGIGGDANGANGSGASGRGGVGGIGANLGGTGGTGTGNGGNGGMGGDGGAGGAGIVGGTLAAIDLSAAEHAWLTDTTVMVTMTGFGGAGGNANGANGGSGTGTGGSGGGGDPNVIVVDSEGVIVATGDGTGTGFGGMGGSGIGNGGDGGDGGIAGEGGTGIDATSRTVGIDLNGASSVALSGLSGAVGQIGTGGNSGSANGGNGGDGTGIGGMGGDGLAGGAGGIGTGNAGAGGAAGTSGAQGLGVAAAADLFDIDFAGSSAVTVNGETIGESLFDTPGIIGAAAAGVDGASTNTVGDPGTGLPP
jgi:hypothetical protein